MISHSLLILNQENSSTHLHKSFHYTARLISDLVSAFHDFFSFKNFTFDVIKIMMLYKDMKRSFICKCVPKQEFGNEGKIHHTQKNFHFEKLFLGNVEFFLSLVSTTVL